MLTKQHFITIADTLRLVKPDPRALERHAQWLATVEFFAAMCADESPRFDRMRWLAYVGNPDLK